MLVSRLARLLMMPAGALTLTSYKYFQVIVELGWRRETASKLAWPKVEQHGRTKYNAPAYDKIVCSRPSPKCEILFEFAANAQSSWGP